MPWCPRSFHPRGASRLDVLLQQKFSSIRYDATEVYKYGRCTFFYYEFINFLNRR